MKTKTDRGRQMNKLRSRCASPIVTSRAKSARWPHNCQDEPQPPEEDVVPWGEQTVFAVDFTSGGAPIGLTMDEWRRSSENSEPRAGWAQAKAVLRTWLSHKGSGNPDDSIGWIRSLGEGLSYSVYVAECSWNDGAQLWEQPVVVRLPRGEERDGLAARAIKEHRLLQYLQSLGVPLRLPTPLALVPACGGLASVMSFVSGLVVDTRAGRTPHVRPWELVAKAATVCHSIDADPLRSFVDGHPTRAAHARACLAILDELDFPAAREAQAWAIENLPPDAPSCLLHGDLLGQNLRLSSDSSAPLGVIDWSEAERGDPAYDLAIVTRGLRRPFSLADGLGRLVDEYNAHSTTTHPEVRENHVRLHELVLLAGFYCQESARGGTHAPAAQQARHCFESFVRRLTALPA